MKYYFVSVPVVVEGLAGPGYLKKFEDGINFPGIAFQFLDDRAVQDVLILTLVKTEAMLFESAADASLAQSICADLGLAESEVELVDASIAPSAWSGIICHGFKGAETCVAW